jgi:branched-chain amino acid transport system permease protein
MLIYGATMVLIMVIRPEGIMGQYEIGPKLIRSIFSRKTGNGVNNTHG